MEVGTTQQKGLTVVVRPSDRARWDTLHGHLHKLDCRIRFEHMLLLEEVHYTRNPAGGGLKAATWLVKVRGSKLSFATADGVIAFLLRKLQDPAVAADARAEAAAPCGSAIGSSTGNRSGQLAGQQVQRSVSGAFQQPPAKKQCVPSAAACSDAAAGAAAGAFAVACAAQQQQITARGTAGHLQGGLHRQSSLVHMRSSDTGSAAGTLLRRTVSDAAAVAARPDQQQFGRAQKRALDSAQISSQAAGHASASQHSVDLMATGTLLTCSPQLKKHRSLGASSDSRGSRPSSAVSGRQSCAADSEQQSIRPPRPSLVYDTRRPGQLDLMTALGVTGSEVMSWLAATGAEDVPTTGEELVMYMMDGVDPVVSLHGLSSASVRELRDVLGGEFSSIVRGYHNKAREAEISGMPQQQRQRGQQQQNGEQEGISQSASAPKRAAGGMRLGATVPAAAESNGTPGSTGSDATGIGLTMLAGCPASVPVAVKSPHGAQLALGSTPPLHTGSITDSCKQATVAAMHPLTAAACMPVKQSSRLGCISKPELGRAAAAFEADANHTIELHLASPRSGDSCDSDSPGRVGAAAAGAAGGLGEGSLERMLLQDSTIQDSMPPAGAFKQLQRRDPRQKLHAASIAAAAAAAGAGAAVPVGMVAGGAAAGAGSSKGAAASACGTVGTEAAVPKSGAAQADPGAAVHSATAPAAAEVAAAAAAAAAADGAGAAPAAAGAMDPAQLARIQAENAELRQKVAKAREERDAAILLCRQYHEQMLQNSHVFGLLSLVFGEEPGTAAQGPAAAAQQQDMQE